MNIRYCSPHLIHKIKFWVYPKSSFCGSIRICNLDLSEYRTHFTEQYCLCLSKQNLTWMALCKTQNVAHLLLDCDQGDLSSVALKFVLHLLSLGLSLYMINTSCAHSLLFITVIFFFLSRCETVGISNVLMVNCLFKDDVEEKLRSKITSRSILKVAVRQLVGPHVLIPFIPQPFVWACFGVQLHFF